MTPDLDTLIARLQGDAIHYGNPTYEEAATALEQMRAELAAAHRAYLAGLKELEDERNALRAELVACKADAERYRWLTNEPEGARHLLSLLQREGSKSIGTFGTMIDRIRASKNAARAQGQGGE